MDSRLFNILVGFGLVIGLFFSAKAVVMYVAKKNAPLRAAEFRMTRSKIAADLGTTASKASVSYKYDRGDPVKVTIDQMAIQSGMPLVYSGTATTKSGIDYSGELAGALTHFCINERLTSRRTPAGTIEIVPK